MEWISNNWFFLLFAAIFIGMHVFGFGCGAHGKHGKHAADEESDKHIGEVKAGSSDGSTAQKSHSSCH